MVRKSLAQILIDRKLFTALEIEEYQAASQENHQTLEDYLKAHALIKEEDLARAYAELFDLPFIELITEKMADPELLSRIPLKFLREHIVIPVWYNEHPTIVTSNPSDFQPIDELTLLLGKDTRQAFEPEV